jgi:uncharacterized protein YbjT (DUF2867 family)
LGGIYFNYSYSAIVNMSKLITVFGATGNQGGSVIRYILDDAQLSKEFSIRAVTRDPSKPAAKTLAEKGVEVVSVGQDTLWSYHG